MSFSAVLQESRAKVAEKEAHYQAVRDDRAEKMKALAEQADNAMDLRRNRRARIDAGELAPPKPRQAMREVWPDVLGMMAEDPKIKRAQIAKHLGVGMWQLDLILAGLRAEGRMFWSYADHCWVVIEKKKEEILSDA